VKRGNIARDFKELLNKAESKHLSLELFVESNTMTDSSLQVFDDCSYEHKMAAMRKT
jgi:hypothetical protein